MNNLQEATERICELKGNLVALDALASALLHVLPAAMRGELAHTLEGHAEVARTLMLHAAISDHTIAAFERDVNRLARLIAAGADAGAAAPPAEVDRGADPVLLSAARITTFAGTRALTGASGFFFERDERLFLVTSRHVLIDEPTHHFPDRIEVEVHADEHDLTRAVSWSMLLYRDRRAVWRQGTDGGGAIDVAVIECDRKLSAAAALRAFTPAHLQAALHDIGVGTPLLIVGFPLGFHDHRHHLPVVRQAAVASSFGVRFQGQGTFLTDARTHRGTSGAPVLMHDRAAAARGEPLPWKLLGVHSSRLDMAGRDQAEDESLGLNCAWYADILTTLTEAA